MGDPIARPGGSVNFDTNERITSTDLDRIGSMALQSLTTFLAWLFRDLVADAPQSGFAGPDDCKVTAAGLDVSVAKGIGFYYDSSSTDDWGMHFKPIVVQSAQTSTLGAHHATLPRIDIVCLAPATEEDMPASRFIKDPSTGTVAIASVNKRTQITHTLQVVAGTPNATPAAPATPSGYLKVAECLVPAASGALTITDTRPILTLGHAFSADPSDEYVSSSGFVPGAGNELVVAATSPASMFVTVAAGECVIPGAKGVKRYRYEADTLTVSAADPTNPRVDLVVADDDGTLQIVAGTPAASPVAPSVGTGQVPLAQYVVAAAGTTVSTGDITDLRVREPFGSDQLRSASVTAAKLATGAVSSAAKVADGALTAVKQSVVPVIPALTKTSGGMSAPAVISVQMKDADGNNVSRVVRCIAEVFAETGEIVSGTPFAITETGAGAAVTTGPDRLIFDTDANGAAELTITQKLGGVTYYVHVVPQSTPGSPALAQGYTS